MTPPRFGLFLPSAQFAGRSATQALELTVAAAVAAEDAGLDEVWVAEHHFQSYGVCPSALTMAAHLLGGTRRITVGTAVTVLATQHPIAVAEQALLLDQVSGGRFRLGVGRGGPWIDLRVFGAPQDAPAAGFAAALDTVLAALRGERLPGAGAPDRPLDVALVPPPRTRPRPEVLVAATADPTVDLAARRGVPLLLGMHADDREKAAALARHGAAGPAHLGVGIVQVADTDQEAEETVRQHLPRWLGPGLASYRRADGRPHRTRDPHAYTEHLIGIHPVGSPERCRARLERTLATTGLRRIALLPDTTGDVVRTKENLHRLAAEVVAPIRTR